MWKSPFDDAFRRHDLWCLALHIKERMGMKVDGLRRYTPFA